MVSEELADKLRSEPYHILWNNCLVKSFRFKRRCLKEGIKTRVVIVLGITRVRRRISLVIPILHAWAEIDGCRIELARPLESPSLWGTRDSEIQPLAGIWI